MKTLVTLSALALATLLTTSAHAQDTKPPDAPKADAPKTDPAKPQEQIPALTKEELEKKFAETLNGATLTGRFTAGKGDKGEAGGQEKYAIDSAKKLAGDYWLITARIQYGNHDATVPLPLRVLWAGDTPVITLDKFPVPSFGTFSARVMIYDNKYAGTWDGGNHGGLLSGRITKEKPADAASDDKSEKAVEKK
jgi:hypothetical protein